MVTVTYSDNVATSGFSFYSLAPDLAGALAANATNRSTTAFTVTNPDAFGLYFPTQPLKYKMTGTGFTYASNKPNAGTITKIEILNSDNEILVTMTGFSINVPQLMTAAADFNDATPDSTGLNAIFNAHSYNFTGETSNDIFFSGASGDQFNGGGGGQNTVSYHTAAGPVIADLLANTTPSLNSGAAAGDTYTDIQRFIGSGFNDVLRGDDNNNFLNGGPGGDVLVGRGGFDTADYFTAQAAVTVDLGNPLANSGIAAGDSYDSIENIRGSQNHGDVLKGNTSSNLLIGMGGGDRFVVTGGHDTIADFNRSSGTYNSAEGDKIDFSGIPGVYDFADVQARLTPIETGVQIADDGYSLTLTGVTVADLTAIDFIYTPAPDMVVTVQGNGRSIEGTTPFSAFWGFGDSVSDTGWFHTHDISTNTARQDLYELAVAEGGGRPTSVDGTMNVEFLANFFGLSAIAVGKPGGTNYAASGATITDAAVPNTLAPSVVDQVDSYLTDHEVDPDAIYFFTGGANSNRVAAALDIVSGIAYMQDEAHAMADKIIALHEDGAQHIMIATGAGGGVLGAAYINTLWADLAEAGVSFMTADNIGIGNGIVANATDFTTGVVGNGITDTRRPPVGPFNAINPYDPADGGSVLNVPTTPFFSSWALFGTANQANSQHWLFADNEHFATAGHELHANALRSLLENGVPIVGQKLTANVTHTSSVATPVTYQWQRKVSGDWVDISGATGETYTVKSGDLDRSLRVEVTRLYDDDEKSVIRYSAPTEKVISVSTLAVDDRWYVSRGTTATFDPATAVLGNDLGSTRVLDSVADPINGSVAIVSSKINFTATSSTAPLTAHFNYNMTATTGSDTAHVEIGLVTTTGSADKLTVATLAGEFSYIDGKGGNDTITGGAGIDTLLGGSSNDKLYGLSGKDVLEGGSGSDTLDGGTSADTMRGGTGDDTYIVDNTNDVVTEIADQGTDTVRSSATFALAGNIENLVLTGAADIDGTGNGRANTITGNAGKNKLNGGGGDDTYIVGTGDTVTETSGQGTDTVRASVTFALGANIENLVLTGSNGTNGTGNGAANSITGNDQDNFINGKGGNDILSGLGGKDAFLFDTALNPTTNVDTITDYSVADDTIRLSKSIFTVLTGETLGSSRFFIGAAAFDGGDRIIYNDATGDLFYDADGTGAIAAIKFAVISPGLAMVNTEFVLVG